MFTEHATSDVAVTTNARPTTRTPRRKQQTPLARHRRLAKLARSIAATAGIISPTPTEQVILQQAATLAMRLADLQAAVERGDGVDGDLVLRTGAELRRTLAQLPKLSPPAKPPSPAEYLAQRLRERASASEGSPA